MKNNQNINFQFPIFNFQNLIGFFAFLFLLGACEQTVENPELPYDEQLVIRAVLEQGKPVDNIVISRTLHPLAEYNSDSALIKDALALIKSDGVVYPLIFDGYSFYHANGLLPESGKKYTLEVKWKDKIATASTIVPEPVEIDTLYYTISKITYDWGYTEWNCNVKAEFKPKKGAVYTGYSTNDFGFYNNYIESIHRFRDTLSNGKIGQLVLQIGSYDSTDAINQLNYYTCFVDSYDYAFYDYFITRWEGGSGDDIFGTSGVNVRGNIQNGIGMFVGKATTSKRINF